MGRKGAHNTHPVEPSEAAEQSIMGQRAIVAQKYRPCAQSLSLQSAPHTEKGRTAVVTGSISSSEVRIDPMTESHGSLLPKGGGVGGEHPKSKVCTPGAFGGGGGWVTDRAWEVSASKFPLTCGTAWEKQTRTSPGLKGRGRGRFPEPKELWGWGGLRERFPATATPRLRRREPASHMP